MKSPYTKEAWVAASVQLVAERDNARAALAERDAEIARLKEAHDAAIKLALKYSGDIVRLVAERKRAEAELAALRAAETKEVGK